MPFRCGVLRPYTGPSSGLLLLVCYSSGDMETTRRVEHWERHPPISPTLRDNTIPSPLHPTPYPSHPNSIPPPSNHTNTYHPSVSTRPVFPPPHPTLLPFLPSSWTHSIPHLPQPISSLPLLTQPYPISSPSHSIPIYQRIPKPQTIQISPHPNPWPSNLPTRTRGWCVPDNVPRS